MNARDAALIEIDAKHLPGLKPRSLRRSNLPGTLSDRNRGLARQIELGVVQHLLHLLWILEFVSGRPLKRIDPAVAKVCLVGLYQIRFMDGIPASAAVDEAVNQARRFRLASAAGFVNAVLRKAALAQV
ncbi:MAG: transcription antitermination factor NusB, partial [Phycisphaerae bacterium]